MAKSDRSTDSIERLLEERSQYQQWLVRLEGSAAPDTVKTRVRADYEARLDNVLGQLRSHESTIVEALAQHEGELATLESREASILETLAEAEVRHAVGEYEDKQWSEISSGQKKSLHEVRSGLERLRGEVGRLTEVQRLIRAAPAEPEPEAPTPALAEPAAFAPPVAPAPETQAPAAGPPPAEPSAPRYVPKPPAPTPAQRLAGDELDFLKSVAVDQSASLSPAAAEKQRSASSPMVTTGSPADPPAPAPAATSALSAARAPAAPSGTGKTLKCGDCGTLNRPTEWYCERCGAELAAL